MQLINRKEIESVLVESLNSGVNHRELRLSEEEAEYVKAVFPKVILIEMDKSPSKTWYEVIM